MGRRKEGKYDVSLEKKRSRSMLSIVSHRKMNAKRGENRDTDDDLVEPVDESASCAH